MLIDLFWNGSGGDNGVFAPRDRDGEERRVLAAG